MSNVSNGVFRSILEYQIPKVLLWRYSDPSLPIEGHKNRHFPAIEKLDYNNYLVNVNELPNETEY